MKNIFKPGDIKSFVRKVALADTAAFDSGQVHPVYATFALARDAEWCCRLFVLDMKESHEEGIGTMVTIQHLSPALINDQVSFTATVKSIERNEIICSYVAKVGDRIIARGEQGQKILPKEKIERIFASL
jgi:predicted thioesterase